MKVIKKTSTQKCNNILIFLLSFILICTVSCKKQKDHKSEAKATASFATTPADPDMINIDLGQIQLKENVDNQTIKDVVAQLNNKKQISHKKLTNLLIDFHIRDFKEAYGKEPKRYNFGRQYRDPRKLDDKRANQLLKDIVDELKSKDASKELKNKYEQYIKNQIGAGKIVLHTLAGNIFDIMELRPGRINAYSGTSLYQIIKRLLKEGASFEKDNNVVIFQADHVLPGYLKQEDVYGKKEWILYGVETLKSGKAIVHFGPSSRVYEIYRAEPIRVIDAQYFAVLELLKFYLTKDNIVKLIGVAIKKTAKKYNIKNIEMMEEIINFKFPSSVRYHSPYYQVWEIDRSYFKFGKQVSKKKEVVDKDREGGSITRAYSNLDDDTEEDDYKKDGQEENQDEKAKREALFRVYNSNCGYKSDGKINNDREFSRFMGVKLKDTIRFTSKEQEFLKKLLGNDDYEMFMKGYSGLMLYCLSAINENILKENIRYYEQMYGDKGVDRQTRRELYSRLVGKIKTGEMTIRYTDWAKLSNLLFSIASKVVKVQNHSKFLKLVVYQDTHIKKFLLKVFFLRRLGEIFSDIQNYTKLEAEFANPSEGSYEFHMRRVGKYGRKTSTEFSKIVDKTYYRNGCTMNTYKNMHWHPDYAYAKYLQHNHKYENYNRDLRTIIIEKSKEEVDRTALIANIVEFFKNAGKYSSITLGAIYGGRKGMAVAGALWQFSEKYWDLQHDNTVSEGYRISKAVIAGIHGLGYGLQGGAQAGLQGVATVLDGIVPPLVEKGTLSFADASKAIQKGTIEGVFVYIVGKAFGPLGQKADGKQVSKDIVEAIYKNKGNQQKLSDIAQLLVSLAGQDLSVSELKKKVAEVI